MSSLSGSQNIDGDFSVNFEQCLLNCRLIIHVLAEQNSDLKGKQAAPYTQLIKSTAHVSLKIIFSMSKRAETLLPVPSAANTKSEPAINVKSA